MNKKRHIVYFLSLFIHNKRKRERMKKSKIKKTKFTRLVDAQSNKAQTLLPKLKTIGLFHSSDVKQLGISQPTLSRWVSAGLIQRLGTGIYQHPDHFIPSAERDYAIACFKFGTDSVIGGLTALFHYGLIEQVPQRIWVIVPHQIKTKDPLYRCLRTKTDSHQGIEDHGTFRITNIERTLVEAFRYSSKIGLRIALHATRSALSAKRTSLQKILRQAKALGLERFVEQHWESIIPEGQAA
jgi:predicted transcriptional regulator of viral defense system